MKTGGQLIVDTLKANGVERLFCVPGESYLAVLDALVDSGVGVTVCRQEGGAAMMADSWGRLTGKPGICFVTRGPGATNATAGLHIACSSARSSATPANAKPSRKSSTAAPLPNSPNGSARSTTRPAFPNSSTALSL